MLKQGINNLEGLLSEASGERSREVVVITGGNFPAGTVLGKITASGQYTEHNPSGSNGSETAVAVLGYNVDASSADQDGVVFARDCEWSDELLTFKDGATAQEQSDAKTELAAVGIVVR